MAEQRPTISVTLSTVRSGDDCPECNCQGRLYAYTSRAQGSMRVRYLKCDLCSKLPEFNQERIPESLIRHRQKRST